MLTGMVVNPVTEAMTYFDALTSIDVANWMNWHAVCEKTANLAYQKESGAMNEVLIFGAHAMNITQHQGPNWLIEDI
jgi:Zn-dependent metalloprotease